jgi:hypothetical protein
MPPMLASSTSPGWIGPTPSGVPVSNHNREHYGLQVVGFDWLARRGRAIRENLIKTGVAVRQHARVT